MAQEITGPMKTLPVELELRIKQLEELTHTVAAQKGINQDILDKLDSLDIKTKELSDKIQEQESRIVQIEKMMKQKNLLFFGVPEKEKGYNDLENAIVETINKNFQVKCDRSELEVVRRFGRKVGEKITPVLVTFTTMGKKAELLKHTKNTTKSGPSLSVME
ncbi:unnamed protein product [Plutella xylostella]|uniref:(diamondback moth) hypothetical protein n=1 Tax=Plutella xylostella TaxID=51655 RepID=A0A8S4E652_PLUXY|nr:uncharacterized protein LOC105391235 [Plutella xylostella]CAG9110780.1 unnamed protein product [Plutella xylostella]